MKMIFFSILPVLPLYLIKGILYRLELKHISGTEETELNSMLKINPVGKYSDSESEEFLLGR